MMCMVALTTVISEYKQSQYSEPFHLTPLQAWASQLSPLYTHTHTHTVYEGSQHVADIAVVPLESESGPELVEPAR
jgi:hypothetical protein